MPGSSSSPDHTVFVPERVCQRARQSGADARRWLEMLPELIRALEYDWHIRIGPAFSGGSAAYVATATTTDGGSAVVKLNLPDDGFEQQIGTLVRAQGNGYARVLRADVTRNAVLLEALGLPLERLPFTPEQSIALLCRTLKQAWQAPPAPDQEIEHKAQGLRQLITELWEDLGHPCSHAVIAQALDYSDRRIAAFVPERCVLVHGDPHPGNLLAVNAPRAGSESGFVFVDPDGFVGEPEYDLGVVLRDWCPQLLAAPDPARLARGYCALLAQESDLSERAIWEWGYIERVSTGLYISAYGTPSLGQPFLETAHLLLD